MAAVVVFPLVLFADLIKLFLNAVVADRPHIYTEIVEIEGAVAALCAGLRLLVVGTEEALERDNGVVELVAIGRKLCAGGAEHFALFLFHVDTRVVRPAEGAGHLLVGVVGGREKLVPGGIVSGGHLVARPRVNHYDFRYGVTILSDSRLVQIFLEIKMIGGTYSNRGNLRQEGRHLLKAISRVVVCKLLTTVLVREADVRSQRINLLICVIRILFQGLECGHER